MIKTKSLLIIYLKIIKNRFLNFKAGITFAKNSYVWRHYNSHNEVAIGNNFIFENVSVGKGSYGILEVYDYGTQNEKLVIGNFVSIGDNAKFLLGGNHQLKTFTTFPLKSKFGNKPNALDATTNGPIIIEDEVWIGLNVIILSGVTIGRGAIIAAGSVVTKDIPAYTIFGGNPAKKIKDRFSSDLIEKLNRIWIKDFDQSTIMENIELFYCDLENSIDEILKLKVK